MFHIWSDNKAHEVKEWIIEFLESKWFDYTSYWSQSENDTCDITEFIPLVCEEVRKDWSNYWIMICWTGIGVDIGANRFTWIRSVLAQDEEIAERWKKYDNANILCLSWWKLDKETTYSIVDAWVSMDFEDEGWRRSKRMKKMDEWK